MKHQHWLPASQEHSKGVIGTSSRNKLRKIGGQAGTCGSLCSISAWTLLVTACLSGLPNTGACARAFTASAARSSLLKS